MRRPPEKPDPLDQRAVRGLGENCRGLGAVTRPGVDHHGHVDIVEMAFGDELGLAQHELDLALRDSRRPLLDVDELFGRHGEER